MDRKEFVKRAGILALGSTLPLGACSKRNANLGRLNAHQNEIISLAGDWQYRLDPDEVGKNQQWFDKNLTNKAVFPGSTDEADIGEQTEGPACGHLSREWHYIGACWLQKEIMIPEKWAKKHVKLFLERCIWETQVWLDRRKMGSFDSLSVPHKYELGQLAPGKHIITIRVDNSPIVAIGDYGHAYTEHTQSKWNGIVGSIELQAHDPVWIQSTQVYPSVEEHKIRVAGNIKNSTGEDVAGKMEISVFHSDGTPQEVEGDTSINIAGIVDKKAFEVEVQLGEDIILWDEFAPELYDVELTFTVDADDIDYSHIRRERFGMRNVGTKKQRVTINNRPVTLRGNLECCIFPETGHPPTDAESWRRLMKISKDHGLNHLRFHSWCPPGAAFIAADEEGMILQVETPLWYDYWVSERRLLTCTFTENDSWQKPKPFGEDPEVVTFIENELNRIIDTYGNHPSFCLFGIGNEIGGDYDLMNKMIEKAKARDPRHLYACSTAREHVSADDYYVTHQTKGGPVRGIKSDGTATSFEKGRNAVDVPVISHEIGQYVVHPDFTEISKYSGPLKPRNLQYFKKQIEQNGLLPQVKKFNQASGTFAWKLYKEEIEAALRTPLAGFQLLQLQDFPGQGEALVGLLDAFWDSKGILDPAEFREFCNQTVPLIETDAFVWTTDEQFEARAMVHHAGEKPLRDAEIAWSIEDRNNTILFSDTFIGAELMPTQIADIGQIEADLGSINRAQRLTITVNIKGIEAKNSWDIWVYPSKEPIPDPDNIMITNQFDGRVQEALSEGEKVLLLPSKKEDALNRQKTRFTPVFWSFMMFQDQPGCLGVLCDSEHPALAKFPTRSHSDWQWKELMNGGQSFILNELPDEISPVVQVIDDFHRGNKLGAILEVQVGEGKLLISGLDIRNKLDERPVARQLRNSLLNYMNSDQFDPDTELSVEEVNSLLA